MRGQTPGVFLLLLFTTSFHACTARDLLAVLQQGEQPLGTEVTSAFQWRSCTGDIVYQPTSTDDVVDVVRLLYSDRSSTDRTYHITVSHQNFYPHNNISCAEVHPHIADPETSSPVTLVLDLSRMDKTLSINVDNSGHGTVTVESGMTFEALTEQLLSRGLGLPGWLTAPPFAGMSLAEVLSTAAHGSAVQCPASIAAFLDSALLVDGTGQVQSLALPGPLLEGSLGLLGVVTELTLKVEPARKATVWERVYEDTNMAHDINMLLLRQETKALEVMWNPSAGGFTARTWKEAEQDAPGDYVNGLFVASSAWLDKVGDMLALDQEDQTASQPLDVMCEIMGDLTNMQGYTMRQGSARVHVAGQSRFREAIAATGYTGRLGAARCVSHSLSQTNQQAPAADECLWKRAKLTPQTLAIAAKDLDAWVEDVGSVLRSTTACGSFMVFMRFLGRSATLMSPSWGQPTVSLSILSLSSLKYNGVLPPKQQQLLDEILQRTLCKYAAQPHWGLATNRLLAGRCGAAAALGTERLERFAARRARYDPQNLFSSPIWEHVAAGGGAVLYPGCALAKLSDCFCEDDMHCGPGFACVPGLTFPEFKVCRVWGNQNVGSLLDEL